MNTKKSISYRKCLIKLSDTDASPETLQVQLNKALEKLNIAGDRYEGLDTEGKDFRAIAEYKTIDNCLCGHLTTFTRNSLQEVISDDEKASKLTLNAVSPPKAKEGGANQQFVPGIIYFVVVDNHVALVCHKNLHPRSMELHFNWLLKDKSSILDSKSSFALSAEVQKATQQKIKKSHVNSIRLGQPLMEHVTLDTAASDKSKKTKKVLKPKGRTLDFIKSMLSERQDLEKLGLDDVYDQGIQVWIEIKFPPRQRKREQDTVELMDTLGVALKDIDADGFALKLGDGSVVQGDDVKISGDIDVTLLSNAVPDTDLLYPAMIEWLKSQLENNNIEA